MSKKFNNQGGTVPVLILIASVGLIAFFLVSQTADFRDSIFNSLFPKPASHAQELSAQAPSTPDEILLKFKPGVSQKAKDTILNQNGLTVKSIAPHIDIIDTKVSEQAKNQVIQALSHNPNIQFAEPNYLGKIQFTPNDPKYAQYQTYLPLIKAPAGWDITQGSSNIITAVIDTGINYNHEDLAGKVILGWDYVDNDNDPMDEHNHGTFVAGVTGALTNNGLGIAGVNWRGKILDIRDADPSGSFGYNQLVNSITYAADNGARVINMSQGGTSASSALNTAVNYALGKGAILVAAAGNSGNSQPIFYPAAIPGVMAVGGTDGSGNLWSSSDTGPNLTVVAPAVSIAGPILNGGYVTTGSGTSFASPQVAGLAALILSINPNLTNKQVKDIITSTADQKISTSPASSTFNCSSWNSSYGCGLININNALVKANSTVSVADTQSPTASITAPAGGTTVSGITVPVNISVSDNVGVTNVELYLDNNLYASTITSPYDFIFDSTTVANGPHTLTAKAYDAAGNAPGTSAVTINVNNIIATPSPIPTQTPLPTPTSAPTSTPVSSSPVISNISSSTTANTATIRWTTNVPTSSFVKYGKSSTSLNLTSNTTTNNTVTLTGLSAKTTYYYQIISTSSNNLSSTSSVQQLRTKNR